jgi:P-type E1-E2 ATPase
VLATPCPLLIAAPVAFMGGMSRAARDGIIVKGGGTLEQMARTRTVAFDKTGTLTYGQPGLDAVNPVPPLTADELLALAASAEQSPRTF